MNISNSKLDIREQKTVAISTRENHRLTWMEFQLALDLWCTVLPISNLLDILTSGNDLEFITVSDCRLEKSPYRVAMPFYMRNHTHGSATSLQWMSNKSTASRLHNWTSCSHDEDAGVCTGARLRTSYMVDRTPTSNPRAEISQSTLAGNHRLSCRSTGALAGKILVMWRTLNHLSADPHP